MKMKRAFFFVLLATELVACTTTRVGINYSPPAQMTAAPSSEADVSVGRFSDDRGEPPNWLGAIRGGYGNPLKKLESDQPVSELVTQVFAAGLKARGLAAESSTAQYALTGSIKELDCSQFARKEANVQIQLVVHESKNGKQVFSNLYHASNVEGSALTLSAGIFGSVEELRALMEKTLQQAVDQALDDPALRSAVRPASP
jgi:hypothetical protein